MHCVVFPSALTCLHCTPVHYAKPTCTVHLYIRLNLLALCTGSVDSADKKAPTARNLHNSATNGLRCTQQPMFTHSLF